MKCKFEKKKQRNPDVSDVVIFGNVLTLMFDDGDRLDDEIGRGRLLTQCIRAFGIYKDQLPSEYEMEWKNKNDSRNTCVIRAKDKGSIVFDVNACSKINPGKLVEFCDDFLKEVHKIMTGETLENVGRKQSKVRDFVWHIDASVASDEVQTCLQKICTPCTGVAISLDEKHKPEQPDFCPIF